MPMRQSRCQVRTKPNRLVLGLVFFVPTGINTATTPPVAGWQQVSAIFDGGEDRTVLSWLLLPQLVPD